MNWYECIDFVSKNGIFIGGEYFRNETYLITFVFP